MVMRTRRNNVVFGRPFLLNDVGRTLPAGEYEVLTDEELIDGLSFPVYRRVSTMIIVPAAPPRTSSIEMLTIDPRELQAALDRDVATHEPPAGDRASLVPGPNAAGDLP
jgi:hypothetical protein